MRERSRGKLFALVAAVAVIGCLAGASSASAAIMSQFTTLGSYTDARGDFPARSGTIVRADYGPFTIPAASGGGVPPAVLGQIHNQIDQIGAPCTGCYITDIVPGLVFGTASAPNGINANLDGGVMMHHFLIANTGKTDATCPGTGQGLLGERFFASGNERTHMHMPNGFGYQNNNNWYLVTHLVNRNTSPTIVWVEIVFRYVPAADPVRPIWLDIDGMGTACNDSEYTIPTGYSDTHQSWTSTVNGRLVALSGHLHDVDITGPGACLDHCAVEGGGRAVSAELVGGPASDYYGPNPPTNPPPADLTGATICRSEGYFGTPFAGTQWRSHLDTLSICGVETNLPAGHQPEAYPPGGAWPPADGYQIKSGQVIKLHSEYQNDSGFSQTDAMGIMVGWLSPTEPGYPRPKAATPMYASLVPAYTPCASPNRTHPAPLSYSSCNPPSQASGQLTVGTVDANGAAPNFVGSVKMVVVNGNTATVADEADVTLNINLQDVRKLSDLSDYTGQLQVRPTLKITDRNNGPAEVGSGMPVDFPVTVPCTATGSATIGSTCALLTSADAVNPGTVRETRRSNWEVGQIKVYDGGPDGLASTTPNTLFAVQGVFVP